MIFFARHSHALIFMALVAIIPIIMNACGQFHPHSDGSTTMLSTEDVLAQQSLSIIQDNCTSCHREGGSAVNFQFNSAQDFISAGMITPGNPGRSPLIFRLQNYSAEDGSNNMPLAAPSLNDQQYQTLYNWVLQMPSGTSPFQCTETELNLADLQSNHAKRLSLRQLENSLVDLLARALGQSAASSLVSQALSEVSFPEDTGVHFKRENNSFNGQHTQAYFDLFDNLSSQLSQNHLNSLVQNFINLDPGACQSINVNSLSTTCRNQLIRNFVSRAYRRPLRESGLTTENNEGINELAAFLVEFNSVGTQEGVDRMIFRALLSPHFLFQLEDQDLLRNYENSDNIYLLNSFAVINRLSYRFWNSMPDEELIRMASSEDLSDTAQYLLAVNYALSQKDKVGDSVEEYFNDWLELDDLPQLTNTARLSAIDNQVQFNSSLRQAMIDEVEELGSYTALNGGSFEDLFTTDISFARQSSLMRIYGLNQSAPVNVSESNAVRFPASQRSGLLTRAAMLTSGSEFANPIIRGVHLVKEIMCIDLGTPPGNANNVFNDIEVAYDVSTRERFHIKTSPANCAACHQRINPYGFAFSNYNSFGQYITQEPIFPEGRNSIEKYVNIDASADLSASLGSGTRVQNGMELSHLVANHQSTKSCFAEKYARFAMQRAVSSTQDACLLEKVYNGLDSSGQMIDILRASALEEEFRMRRLED